MIGGLPASLFAVIAGSVLVVRSWKWHLRSSPRIALAFLLLGGLVLRLVPVSVPHLHRWDEAYHAVVAKNMMSDPLTPRLYPDPELPHDPRDWSKAHIWMHKPPLPLWFMAASLRVFGVHLIALRLPSLILSLLLILLIHDIAFRLFDRRVAWISAFLATIHALAIQLTGGGAATDHIDVFLYFFTTLAIWALVRWRQHPSAVWAVLAGVAMGCGVLSKWLVGLFPLALVPIIWYGVASRNDRIRHGAFLLIALAAVALPWELYVRWNFPEALSLARGLMIGHFDSDLEGHAEPWYYHIHKLGMLYGELVYLPMVWIIWSAFRRRDRHHQLLSVWILLPLIIFSFARTKMQAYTIMSAPAVFMSIALFIQMLQEWKGNRTLQLVVIILLLAMPYRQMLERLKPWEPAATSPYAGRWAHLPDELPPCTVVFNEPFAIEMMFHRNVTAYDHVPDPDVIRSIRDRGCTVVLME